MSKTKTRGPNLVALVAQYSKLTTEAHVDLSEFSSETRHGHAAAKREAEEQLPAAKAALSDAVREAVIGIFVVGDKTTSTLFADLASEIGQTLTIAGDAFYQRLTDEVDVGMREDRQILPLHFGTLLFNFAHEVREISDGFGVPNLRYVDGHVLPTRDDLTDYIRDTIRAEIGDGISGQFIFRDILNSVAAETFTGPTIPVVVVGVTAAEIDGLKPLFRDRTITVELANAESVTPEAVMAAFNTLKAQLKSASK